jgi:putative acetyltransferase
MIRIIEGDFSDPRVTDLLRIHLTAARAQTAPGSAHALDVAELQSPEIIFRPFGTTKRSWASVR